MGALGPATAAVRRKNKHQIIVPYSLSTSGSFMNHFNFCSLKTNLEKFRYNFLISRWKFPPKIMNCLAKMSWKFEYAIPCIGKHQYKQVPTFNDQKNNLSTERINYKKIRSCAYRKQKDVPKRFEFERKLVLHQWPRIGTNQWLLCLHFSAQPSSHSNSPSIRSEQQLQEQTWWSRAEENFRSGVENWNLLGHSGRASFLVRFFFLFLFSIWCFSWTAKAVILAKPGSKGKKRSVKFSIQVQ